MNLPDKQVMSRFLLAMTAGAVMTLGFSPYDQVWIVFLSLAFFIHLWQGASNAAAFWYGWGFSLGLQASGVGWIFYSLHVHGGANVPFAFLIIALLSAYLALFNGTASYLAKRICSGNAVVDSLILMPAAYALGEWSQGIVLTGFAWMQPGYTQIDLPLAGYAPLLGGHGVTLLTVLTAGALMLMIQHRQEQRKAVSAGVTIVLIWSLGAALQQVSWTSTEGEPVEVALIQGGIPQKEKWKPANKLPTLNYYRQQTLDNLDADLIVWPETAIPDFEHRQRRYLRELDETVGDRADLLIGIFVRDFDTGRYYNSVIDLDGQVYHKRHLVPLGEFVPLRSLIEFFNRWLKIPMSDIDFGKDEQGLIEVAGMKIGANICFEDAFARDILRDLPEADLLVNLSNDAWFEDSREPHQHHTIARMRSIETGRYMLRATNTGVTSIIGPSGEEVAVAPQFDPLVLRGKVTTMSGSTPYVIWGDWVIVITSLTMTGVGFYLRWRKAFNNPSG